MSKSNNRCPITYKECGSDLYSQEGLRMLARKLENLSPLQYTAQEQRTEGMKRAAKMSIQGVQPKVSAKLNITKGEFEIVTSGGRFIIKPQSPTYAALPENEDLTMKMARAIGIEVPDCGLLWSKDNSLSFFIRRFDRSGHKDRIALEDFAQLSERSRETKYDSSMENVIDVIQDFCTFPVIEKRKLFVRTIFAFLIGNEDMHLKNFSLISREGRIELSPAYDLLSTTLAMRGAEQELALPLRGKRKGITRQMLEKYFGQERLELAKDIIEEERARIISALDVWQDLLDRSFLSAKDKEAYRSILRERLERMEFGVKI